MNSEISKPLISIVSPVYQAEKIIPELVRRIEKSIMRITDSYEIILVEDGGPDDSWNVIEEIAKKNEKVKGIKLSRNFGQHHAITCGLENTNGEWIVVMDCDLQDQPEEIVKLYERAKEGYDVVLAKRINRKDSFLKRLFSKIFYRALSYLTGSKMDETVANFGIYHRNVINSVCSLKENIRYFPTMVKWVGFKQIAIPINHAFREDGKSSYNFKRLMNLALDIILANSDKPIKLMIKLGISISSISFLMAAFFLIQYLTGNVTVQGYTSLILSIWFFSGIILVMLGIVGLYVGKTFESAKRRPVYIIQKFSK